MGRSPFDDLMQDVGHETLNVMHGEAASYDPPANSVAGVDDSVSGLTVRVQRFEQTIADDTLQRRVYPARVYVRGDATTPEPRGKFNLSESSETYIVTSAKLIAGEWECECERGAPIGSNVRTSEQG